MTIRQPDGSAGLLSTGKFGNAVRSEISGLGLEKEVVKVVGSGDQVCQSKTGIQARVPQANEP